MLQQNLGRHCSLLRYVLVTIVVAVSALNYLHLKHQYHLIGLRKVALEKELDALRTRSRDLDWQISALASHSAVQARTNVAALKLRDIPEGSVVNLRFLPPSTPRDGNYNSSSGEGYPDELQTISHER
jgi:hypothetical protein